jgi:hypothetical protein
VGAQEKSGRGDATEALRKGREKVDALTEHPSKDWGGGVSDPRDDRRHAVGAPRPKKSVSESSAVDALPLSFIPLGLFTRRSEDRSLGAILFEPRLENEKTSRFYRSAAWKLSGRGSAAVSERPER